MCYIVVVMNKGKLIEKEGGVDYMYLAKTTSPSISILITYIVFVTKMQKGKPTKIDLPL